MYPCNRGEMLTRSVHENAANRMLAIRARVPVCERPELFIGFEACDNRGIRASSFLWSSSRLASRCDSRLERNAMTGSQRLRACACADLVRPLGILVVRILI